MNVPLFAGTRYLTTAIDYVNGVPHFGHAYEKIVTDFLARWHRLVGRKVFFLTGTDENAQKNVEAAQKQGIPVAQFVTQNAETFKKLCKDLSISYDDFIRTTEDRHKTVSQVLFQKAFDKGDIYLGKYEGLYCTGCEGFKTEKDLVNNKCPHHEDREIEQISEESYFFKLGKYKDHILAYVESGAVQPESKRNEILQRIKQDGLRDLSVTRINREWGISCPVNDKHKIYVWFDALINYVSGIGYPTDEKFKTFWPESIHIIGKDINWFHTVIWPAILLSCDIPLPKKVFVHGFVLLGGKKMSKSQGVTINMLDELATYGSDQLRYYLLREIPFGDDGEYTTESMITRINNELANDWGNLIMRLVVLLQRNFGSQTFALTTSEEIFLLDLKKVDVLVDTFKINDAIDHMWSQVKALNKYVSDKEPWKIKDKDELARIVSTLLVAVRTMNAVLGPVLPATSKKIAELFDFPSDPNAKLVTVNIPEKVILFEKVEVKQEDASQVPTGKKKLSFSDIALHVGKIIAVKKNPEADKLFIEQIDLGEKKIQIQSGLAEQYTAEELLNKYVVVVTNLKPVTLKGEVSEGMLLAAEKDGVVGIIQSKEELLGKRVTLEGEELSDPKEQISIDDFFTVKLKAKDGAVFCQDKKLVVDDVPLSIDKIEEGRVR
ncbi:MAG: methionine--tRNA ligase [Candidatus Woesearchaeota archaeon]|nr:MAG: methionine--tRNA ligase [Candidatus Woesearchaeota archaeon]